MNPRQQKKLQTNRNIMLLVLVFFLALLVKAVFKEPDATAGKIIGLALVCILVAVVAVLNMYLERYLAKATDDEVTVRPPATAASAQEQEYPKSAWALLKAIFKGRV